MIDSSGDASENDGGVQKINKIGHADKSTSFADFWAGLTEKDPRWKTYNEGRETLHPICITICF